MASAARCMARRSVDLVGPGGWVCPWTRCVCAGGIFDIGVQSDVSKCVGAGFSFVGGLIARADREFELYRGLRAQWVYVRAGGRAVCAASVCCWHSRVRGLTV